ncbi:MAG TPA: formate dehydrogenase subunit alpha [Anaerolineales bacterium]
MMTVTLTINGQAIEVQEGQTVLEAAQQNGIIIPTLCYHKDLSPDGSCRLCVVEVEGWGREVASCTLEASNGMTVHTETPALIQSRRKMLDLLLHHYHDAGYASTDRHQTEFMHWVNHYNAGVATDFEPQARYPVNSDPNPFVWVDLNKCILCTRCVRACEEIQGRFVWGVGQRGAEAKIIAGADTTMLSARCESCGACVAYCPTGALDDKLSVGSGMPDKLVTTTCPYCGVGCNFDLNVKDDRIIRVTSNPNAAVNGMHLCVKGRYGYDYIHHPDRLTKPRVRKYLLDGGSRAPEEDRGDWVEVDWDTALGIVARKFVQIKKETGPDAVAVLTSAKCTNEENYLMQKFSRQVIGTHNVDHCARLCHSSTVAGLAMCFGSGAMTNTMRDIVENANAIFIIGSNTTEQHPVFGTQIRRAVNQRGLQLVVADPRAIDITEFSALHLKQKPGTDVALINGLMNIILDKGWHDQAFIEARTEGFEEFRQTVNKYTPEEVAKITGISVEELHAAASLLALNKPMAVIWAMGITQHTTGVMNVLSLGNLQMLLGNMGLPGGGTNPLRGQNNVQGACDMGGLPNVFPGYQRVTDQDSREKFASAWSLKSTAAEKAAEPAFGDQPGLTVTEIVNQAGKGDVRAIYILGENPVMTDPDVNHVKECLQACEFLVLQEIFPSETSQYADVLLPGSSWAEKSGTFTNTERRIQLVRPAFPPPGEARTDWRITVEVAKRVLELQGLQPVGPHAGWEFDSPSQVQDEIAALTPSYAGVTHARLELGEQLLWPVKSGDHPGTPILHVGQFTRGKGKFHTCEHLPAEELPDSEYPLYLTTGRVLYHWHGGEMTRRAKGLNEVYPETLVEISPEDAAFIGLNGTDKVKVTSRRGEMIARVAVTDRVAAGVVFGNFHFPDHQNVNNLTIAALDPVAKIPEYKVCAVKVEPYQE